MGSASVAMEHLDCNVSTLQRPRMSPGTKPRVILSRQGRQAFDGDALYDDIEALDDEIAHRIHTPAHLSEKANSHDSEQAEAAAQMLAAETKSRAQRAADQELEEGLEDFKPPKATARPDRDITTKSKTPLSPKRERVPILSRNERHHLDRAAVSKVQELDLDTVLEIKEPRHPAREPAKIRRHTKRTLLTVTERKELDRGNQAFEGVPARRFVEAAVPQPSGLDEWKLHTDLHGRSYYWNSRTKATSWTKPWFGVSDEPAPQRVHSVLHASSQDRLTEIPPIRHGGAY